MLGSLHDLNLSNHYAHQISRALAEFVVVVFFMCALPQYVSGVLLCMVLQTLAQVHPTMEKKCIFFYPSQKKIILKIISTEQTGAELGQAQSMWGYVWLKLILQ